MEQHALLSARTNVVYCQYTLIFNGPTKPYFAFFGFHRAMTCEDPKATLRSHIESLSSTYFGGQNSKYRETNLSLFDVASCEVQRALWEDYQPVRD